MVERFVGWSDQKPGSDAGNSGPAQGTEQDESIAGETTRETGAEIRETETLRIIDPGTRNSSNGPAGATGPKPKRKYTRKTGSRGPKTVSEALVGIKEALVGIHYSLGQFTGCPELRLDDDEADAISKAVHGIAAEYDYENLPKVTKQSFAWANLLILLIALYTGRLYDIAQRKKKGPAPHIGRVHDGAVDLATYRNTPPEGAA